MRFTIAASGLSALWLAFPAFPLPTSPSARTSLERFDIQARDAEPATSRTATVLDHHVAKRQWGAKYGTALSDDFGTDAHMSDTGNLLQPDWSLQATQLFSAKEYGTVVGQDAREPTDWLALNRLQDGGRGSGRDKEDIDLNIITRR